MKSYRNKLYNNYYVNIDHTKIYVDLINKHVKILYNDNISVQNLKRIIHYSCKQHLSKIICNCGNKSFEIFSNAGFKIEGKIPGYFKGKDAFCMSYFLSGEREICSNFSQKESLVKECINVKNAFVRCQHNFEYKIRTANEDDIKEMINLFSSYPSSIYNEEFLRETINKKILCKIAVYGEKIIGVACADMDKENLNAEITYCTTHSSYSGCGILSNIIYSLECDLRGKGFITLYSLPRAINPSTNYVLSKHNYTFTGRMVNNCSICGAFEDMNIWVKIIKPYYFLMENKYAVESY